LPEWYDDAVLANQGSNIGLNSMKQKKIHASEWSWIGSKFDFIIDNNNTIDDLYQQSAQLLKVSNEIPLFPGDPLFS